MTETPTGSTTAYLVESRGVRRVARYLRRRGLNQAPGHTLRARLYRCFADARGWWDWGAYLMSLTGTDFCGSYAPPSPRSIYYQYENGKLVWTKSYERPLNPEANDYWHFIGVQDDGRVLRPGNIYSDNRESINYGLDPRTTRLLTRYILWDYWTKARWFGLRPWLYYKGLHRKVDMRIPFRCNERPRPNSGAYSHWACSLKRRHRGQHAIGAHRWET